MVSSNILWNSVISAKDARFAGADNLNMYVKTPLDWYEYMKMPVALLPIDIIEHYNLPEKAITGYVYMEIQKGMYWLPRAGILANKLLKKWLVHHGYFEQLHTPGLWKHVSCPVWFNLCMDDFGIKYNGRENLQHLYDELLKENMILYKIWKATSTVVYPYFSAYGLVTNHKNHKNKWNIVPHICRNK